jgi:hypothetical protein
MFKLGDMGERNDDLILFCELQNRVNTEAGKIIDKALSYSSSLYPISPKYVDYHAELKIYKQGLATNNWTIIEQKLSDNKMEVFKKLRIKPAGNSVFIKLWRTLSIQL